jgi:hypothetical protein
MIDGFSISSENHAFKKASEWTKHMKEVHDESPFPCTVTGCNRVRGKGYFRERDLVKHVVKAHPDVDYWGQGSPDG